MYCGLTSEPSATVCTLSNIRAFVAYILYILALDIVCIFERTKVAPNRFQYLCDISVTGS